MIDTEVRALRQAGRPVIALDGEQIGRLRPDLLITQGLCDVCAVSDGEVYRLASVVQPAPAILSLGAGDLEGIWGDIRSVGGALALADEADEMVLGLQSRLRRLQREHAGPPLRVLCVEWLDPLYLAGHWVPDLVAAAGGVDVGATPGSPSVTRQWAELPALSPDVVVIMLCGFGVERARIELEAIEDPDALDLFGRIPTWFLDGNQYTSRPGPRVVDGAERIQSALHGIPSSEMERWQPAVRY
jgi:iron complex transport system substrate-binding protein